MKHSPILLIIVEQLSTYGCENEQRKSVINAHTIGAALHFIIGNLGIVVLGVAMAATRRQALLAVYSIASGIVGLLATVLFVSGHYLGAGIGGMERLAAYALPLWLIVVGVSLVKSVRVAPPN